MGIEVLKVFIPGAAAFLVGIAAAPFLAHILFTKKAWKKKAGKGEGMGGGATPIFDELHKERETSTPRMGGILIWGSVLVTALGFFLLAHGVGEEPFLSFDFISRSQTWIPLLALLLGAAVGFLDDYLEIRGSGLQKSGGLPTLVRLAVVALIGLAAGWWFFDKLDISSVGIPFAAPIELGILFIPFFALVLIVLYMGGTIDGIDGLAGGVFSIIFAAYAGIAFFQGQFDLAALSAVIAGATLAFLWFNIPPARFYMTETGSMALTLTLGIIAFSADVLGEGVGVSMLLIIALPLIGTVAATALQVLSKKFRGKKIFLVAPIHNHFEAIGWPPHKVTMRYWVVTLILAVVGMSVALIA